MTVALKKDYTPEEIEELKKLTQDLRDIRSEKALSQREMALLIGVQMAIVTRLESINHVGNPIRWRRATEREKAKYDEIRATPREELLVLVAEAERQQMENARKISDAKAPIVPNQGTVPTAPKAPRAIVVEDNEAEYRVPEAAKMAMFAASVKEIANRFHRTIEVNAFDEEGVSKKLTIEPNRPYRNAPITELIKEIKIASGCNEVILTSSIERKKEDDKKIREELKQLLAPFMPEPTPEASRRQRKTSWMRPVKKIHLKKSLRKQTKGDANAK